MTYFGLWLNFGGSSSIVGQNQNVKSRKATVLNEIRGEIGCRVKIGLAHGPKRR
jgi:hypothetical protein